MDDTFPHLPPSGGRLHPHADGHLVLASVCRTLGVDLLDDPWQPGLRCRHCAQWMQAHRRTEWLLVCPTCDPDVAS